MIGKAKDLQKMAIPDSCKLSYGSMILLYFPLQELVEMECMKWTEKGIKVKYENRNNRNGYKAGALRDGLLKKYVRECEFVAIFDADFQPDKDFLHRTVPRLVESPKLALVQARWKFGEITP